MVPVLAESPRACSIEFASQPFDALANLLPFTLFLVLFLLPDGDAVGLEAATLGEMEKCPSELVGVERFVERPSPQLVGIQALHLLALGGVRRHQSEPDQLGHHPSLALEAAITLAAGLACFPPRLSQRVLCLGLARARIDADPRIDESFGMSFSVEGEQRPADGIGADVDAESVRRGHARAPEMPEVDGRMPKP